MGYFRVCGDNHCKEYIFNNESYFRFPLYWSSEPISIIIFDYDRLHESEKDVVDLLETNGDISVRNLIELENNHMGLKAFICKFILLLDFSLCY